MEHMCKCMGRLIDAIVVWHATESRHSRDESFVASSVFERNVMVHKPAVRRMRKASAVMGSRTDAESALR